MYLVRFRTVNLSVNFKLVNSFSFRSKKNNEGSAKEKCIRESSRKCCEKKEEIENYFKTRILENSTGYQNSFA